LRHGRAQHSGYPGSSGGIVSSFRLICIALVQTESYQAPDRTDILAAAAPQQETAHASGHSVTAQLLVTLAGAISAGIVGWLMIGFGSVRTFKSS
jgi:hypothetical protein